MGLDWIDIIIIPFLLGVGGYVSWVARQWYNEHVADRRDRREFSQQSENVAIDILREVIHELSSESNEMRKRLEDNTTELRAAREEIKRVRESVLLLAGKIGEKFN